MTNFDPDMSDDMVHQNFDFRLCCFFSHKSAKINIFFRRVEYNLTGEFDKFWATFPSHQKMFQIWSGEFWHFLISPLMTEIFKNNGCQ